MKKDNDISVTIAFDEHLFNSQRSYNEDYAKGVNKVLEQLASEIADLTEQDIIDFLSDPTSLAVRLETTDREEYDKYVATLPQSVKASMQFHTDKGETIGKLHKKLPQPSTPMFRINACRIVNGRCVFDEDALKDRCTISGSPALQAVWEKAQDVAKSLNALQEKIKSFNVGMYAVEDSRSFEIGLIRNDGTGYKADIDRLRRLK